MINPADFDEGYYAARYRYAPTSMYWWSVHYYARVLARHLSTERAAAPRILEVGCGLGHLVALLGRRCETWGVDLSDVALRQARDAAPSGRFLRADVGSLPFPDGAFEAAVARHVLEHLADPSAGVDELRRVVRPGGVLLAAMPNPEGLGRSLKGQQWFGFQDPTHVSLLSPGGWRDMFISAGFRVRRQWGDGLWDVPYLPVVPRALQLLLFGAPAALQVLTAGSFVPTRAGESVIFLLDSV